MKDKIVTIILSIILFIVPMAIIPEFCGAYNLAKIIILLICGFVLLITTLIRIDTLQIDKIDILIIIFGLLAILSTIFSQNPHVSVIGERNRYEGLFTVLTYILIYYNSKYFFKNYKPFIYCLSIIYILISSFAIIQFYVGNQIILPPIFNKGANGTFGNTNFMGSFVSIVVPAFTLGFILKRRKLFYIGSFITFSAMIMCIARSSWVAFVFSILITIVYLIVKKNKEYWKRFVIIVITFIVCFNIINLTDRSHTITNKLNTIKSETKQAFETGLENKMGSGRIEIWRIILKLIKKVPILGCGVDALSYGLEQKLTGDNLDFILTHGQYIDKAHNEYLQIAATMGIPALVIYLLFISTIVFKGTKLIFKNDLMSINIIVIISYLIQAFFNISTIGVAPIFWFILGVTSKHLSLEQDTKI